MLEPLPPQEIIDVLRHASIGRLGLQSEGRPYVVPITYAYDAHSIIGHSAPGRKLDALRAADAVCFEVEEVVDLHRWRSVIAWGRYEELRGDPRERALELLVTSISAQLEVAGATAAGAAGHGHADGGGSAADEVAVFRIHLDELHGRSETPASRHVKLRTADTVFAMPQARSGAA